MGAAKKEQTVADVLAANAALNDRLANIERKLETLVDCVLSPSAPKYIRDKGLHVQIRDWKATAKRARMGRVAKRHGMTVHEWIERYGEVERIPDTDSTDS